MSKTWRRDGFEMQLGAISLSREKTWTTFTKGDEDEEDDVQDKGEDGDVGLKKIRYATVRAARWQML